MPAHRNVSRIALSLLCAAVLLFSVWFALPSTRSRLIELTGEQAALPQLRALWNLALELTRPPLHLAPETPVQYARDLSPFGVNTFLEQEVEEVKRERIAQMIRDAGFTWVRQEFPWADIEIHAKGDFEDRRNRPARSAWDKYDHIVELIERYDLELIVRLSAPPKWAHAGYADLGRFGPPADFNDFADYVAAVVSRYKGRIRYYQIWNEPNIYPEWGEQAVNPEDYARLLCLAHDRAKQIDPNVVILAAALAPTIAQDGRDLNDLIFLQRMYNAGAGRCFDIASAQGYGLFSGPYDRRLSPLTTNVSRHVLMRDIMVRNGDAHKPIWLAEANWNAVPNTPDVIEGVGRYGMVTEEEQARYVPQLYERARREWPWVGVIAVWFFKRPSDAERNQSWYYFRMVEPDFTPLPLYQAMKEYIARRSP
ncbi:MAG: cellulase family glycosylhydrolase [Anaerolineae bacterium]|nr:cellulase family glycosylhydrolase [Thermoflexales bacterium]MDW8407327.1 cellulase family glycosylhydrolase [Anaerolineae bacterium]